MLPAGGGSAACDARRRGDDALFGLIPDGGVFVHHRQHQIDAVELGKAVFYSGMGKGDGILALFEGDTDRKLPPIEPAGPAGVVDDLRIVHVAVDIIFVRRVRERGVPVGGDDHLILAVGGGLHREGHRRVFIVDRLDLLAAGRSRMLPDKRRGGDHRILRLVADDVVQHLDLHLGGQVVAVDIHLGGRQDAGEDVGACGRHVVIRASPARDLGRRGHSRIAVGDLHLLRQLLGHRIEREVLADLDALERRHAVYHAARLDPGFFHADLQHILCEVVVHFIGLVHRQHPLGISDGLLQAGPRLVGVIRLNRSAGLGQLGLKRRVITGQVGAPAGGQHKFRCEYAARGVAQAQVIGSSILQPGHAGLVAGKLAVDAVNDMVVHARLGAVFDLHLSACALICELGALEHAVDEILIDQVGRFGRDTRRLCDLGLGEVAHPEGGNLKRLVPGADAHPAVGVAVIRELADLFAVDINHDTAAAHDHLELIIPSGHDVVRGILHQVPAVCAETKADSSVHQADIVAKVSVGIGGSALIHVGGAEHHAEVRAAVGIGAHCGLHCVVGPALIAGDHLDIAVGCNAHLPLGEGDDARRAGGAPLLGARRRVAEVVVEVRHRRICTRAAAGCGRNLLGLHRLAVQQHGELEVIGGIFLETGEVRLVGAEPGGAHRVIAALGAVQHAVEAVRTADVGGQLDRIHTGLHLRDLRFFQLAHRHDLDAVDGHIALAKQADVIVLPVTKLERLDGGPQHRIVLRGQQAHQVVEHKRTASIHKINRLVVLGVDV